jgi:transposase
MTYRDRTTLNHEVVHLWGLGRSARGISQALGISRNTVRKILDAHHRARSEPHTALPPPSARAPRARKVDAYLPRIDDLITRYPDITAQRIFEELSAAGYDGSYTQVKVVLRKVRPRKAPPPSVALPDYGPGEMAESDWSPYTVTFTSGRKMTVQAFSYVLSHSRRKAAFLYERSDLHALMEGHVQAFRRFEGVARQCKYDSQKAVVLKWEGEQPIYNPRFLAFATHYEFRPVACRRGHPNEKAHVERGFWDIERSFLNGRSFADLDDMRRQLARWLDTVSDPRHHRELRRSPLAAFADEQPHLRHLPTHAYDTARVSYRLCDISGFVHWDGNRYAVPYDHVTDLLPVRITQDELFIYAADLALLARHPLAPKSQGAEVGAAALHGRAGHRAPADADRVKAAVEAMGEGAAEFYGGLHTAHPRLAAYHGRQVLLLRERYATEDICKALRHAHAYGAYDHKAVARILAARAAPRSFAEYVEEASARRLRDEIGARAIPPRDLADYDALPLTPAIPEAPQTEEESP